MKVEIIMVFAAWVKFYFAKRALKITSQIIFYAQFITTAAAQNGQPIKFVLFPSFCGMILGFLMAFKTGIKTLATLK
jgi:hypothetical protein